VVKVLVTGKKLQHTDIQLPATHAQDVAASYWSSIVAHTSLHKMKSELQEEVHDKLLQCFS
jgi:hypothetical protein